MRDWIPVPGTTKEKLIRSALELFSAREYDVVSVHDLAAGAGVTTGSLYHHFGGKPQLYSLVRTDVERRVADRVAGALETHDAPGEALGPALLAGYDWLLRTGYARLIGARPPAEFDGPDELSGVVGDAAGSHVALVALAAWRSALAEAASNPESETSLRAALTRFLSA